MVRLCRGRSIGLVVQVFHLLIKDRNKFKDGGILS